MRRAYNPSVFTGGILTTLARTGREPSPAPDALLTSRDLAVWAAAWLLVSALVVLTGFVSRDPDSALHAGISSRLAQLPASRWIAPEWWGLWNSHGLYREHPAGVFLLPVLLGQLGIPTAQAAVVVGISMGLASLGLVGALVSRVASPEAGRAALVLVQLMPVAFLFRMRANHEYPMLLCLLLGLLAVDGVRRSWWWTWLLVASLTAALLIKGVFVTLVFMAVGLWILLNPSRASGPWWRPAVATGLAVLVMGSVALAYDAAYVRVAGEGFWGPYWRRQVTPATTGATMTAAQLLGHVAFYGRVLFWWTAPWSAAFAVALWRTRGRLVSTWKALPDPSRRGITFALSFVGLAVALISPSSRVAERYAFSPTFVLGALGAVVAYRTWPVLHGWLARLDRAVPALPAMVWLTLMLGRLFLGRFLPRI
jgi:4-amino-4-deoxy-L-arabinose transferase-like glycosyltransferase